MVERCSPCKPSHPSQTCHRVLNAWPSWPGSVFMLEWQPKPINAISWKDCVVTFPARRCPRSVCHSPLRVLRYELKTPYSNGTTHVIFEPIDFLARLAALVPKPRVNLTRFHGVFAPNSKHRIHVTPAKRGKGRKAQSGTAWKDKTQAERHIAITWPFSHIHVLHGT